MQPQPIGITADQWADVDRQLSADVAASQAGLGEMLSGDLGRMSASLSRDAAVVRDMRIMDRNLTQTLAAGNTTALDKVLRNVTPPQVQYSDAPYLEFASEAIQRGMESVARQHSPQARLQGWLGERRMPEPRTLAQDLPLLLSTPIGLAETALTIGTGLVGTAANGYVSMFTGGDTVRGLSMQGSMTYSPRTEVGRAATFGLGLLTGPLASGLESARTGLGDLGYSLTGSPAIGAALYTAPDALLTLLAPEARGAFSNVGAGALNGGKVLAREAGEALYRASESMLNATGQRMYVVAPNGPATAQTVAITQAIGELRAAGAKDAHHVIQDAAVRDLPGYNTNAAPGVQLHGPSTSQGTPHYNATQAQRGAGGGTYGAERQIAYDALRSAGYSEAQATRVITEADRYFNSIGVNENTSTRIPGNRRR